MQPLDFSFNPEYEPDFKWYDQTLMDAVKSDESHAHSFFRLLALCHTVMPEIKDGRLALKFKLHFSLLNQFDDLQIDAQIGVSGPKSG